MKVKKVAIIGGGSSGWMTAAALVKLCPHLKVELVESPNIPTVGVGESTLGHINRYMQLIGLKDEDWMSACNATYKNSIRFTNFRKKDGTHFEYPFAAEYDYTFDKVGKGLNTWSILSLFHPDKFPPSTFSEMFAMSNTLLATYNRQTKNENGKLRHFDFRHDTAYHMDAIAFGQWLKDNICIPNGLKLTRANVIGRDQDKRHNIERLLLDNGQMCYADLFIDCTGFKSMLLEGYMGVPFENFHSHLKNNMAWACRLPYGNDRKEKMHNVTDCQAMPNGWAWHIPLWNRIGTGYVFCKEFIQPKDALEEFKIHLKEMYPTADVDNATFKEIYIKHGRHAVAWQNNVVGIGLAYGFVEPLESTGLLTTHENIIKLCDLLNRRNGYTTKAERDVYNYSVNSDIEGFKEFVSMHYALSERTDTPYWRSVTQNTTYHPDMNNYFKPRLEQYLDVLYPMQQENNWNEYFQGNNYILAGLGIKPASTSKMIEIVGHNKEDYDAIADIFLKEKEQMTEYVKSLPTHYEFLKENIYGGNDEYDD